MLPDRVLTLRELNRATLARQLLLDQATITAPQVIEQLAGLQAQALKSPYISLWTRLRDFRRDDLTGPLKQRQVVKATLMRATLHLVSADDYLLFRPALQPALSYSMRSILRRRADGLDVDRLIAAARAYFEQEPHTFAELRTLLADLEPNRDLNALAYAVRTHLPLVQVTGNGAWGFPGNPDFTTAEAWLGRPLPAAADEVRTLLRRYLAAFGPASIQDFQTWSGLPALKAVLPEIRGDLRSFRDERGRELLDLPDGPLPPADSPAPPRFLPEWDNLLLSHADRTRVIPDAHRSAIFVAPQIRATFLVDGFVAGAWKIERTGRAAALVLEPFEPISDDARTALVEEGERLVRFVEDEAGA
jgi:hypothetical protein